MTRNEPTNAFDVFLSYNSADRVEVEELAMWLRQQRLKVWFDRWELRPGLP
ncbi:MAG: TIR domain-containing protein [Deltaproteobacteria bacterium]|nr:TIR domain-containing protein [Deltaproteobacteria bacterium]